MLDLEELSYLFFYAARHSTRKHRARVTALRGKKSLCWPSSHMFDLFIFIKMSVRTIWQNKGAMPVNNNNNINATQWWHINLLFLERITTSLYLQSCWHFAVVMRRIWQQIFFFFFLFSWDSLSLCQQIRREIRALENKFRSSYRSKRRRAWQKRNKYSIGFQMLFISSVYDMDSRIDRCLLKTLQEGFNIKIQQLR